MDSIKFFINLLIVFLVFIIVYFMMTPKERKKRMKEIKKCSKIYKFINLEYIEDLHSNIIYSSIECYENNKDIIINIIINFVIINFVLKIITTMPIGISRSFVELALVAHIGMWILWVIKEIGFFNPKNKPKDLANVLGFFTLSFIGIFFFTLGFKFSGILIILVSLLSFILSLITTIKKLANIDIKIVKKKRRKIQHDGSS